MRYLSVPGGIATGINASEDSDLQINDGSVTNLADLLNYVDIIDLNPKPGDNGQNGVLKQDHGHRR